MIIRDDNFKPYKLERTQDRIAHVFSYPAQRILLPLMILALVLGVWNFSLGIFIAIVLGIVSQYVNEYCIHRFLYHMSPPQERNGLFNWLYTSHFGHHDFPNNPNLWGGTSLWFTPVFSAVSFLLTWGTLVLIGLQQAWLYAFVAVFLGSVGVYLTYEWAHVTAHAVGQKNALERYISKEHAKHHFHDFGTNFHVSAGGILVDRIAGTANGQIGGQRIKNIRTMGMDPADERLVGAREEFAEKYNITDSDRQKALA